MTKKKTLKNVMVIFTDDGINIDATGIRGEIIRLERSTGLQCYAKIVRNYTPETLVKGFALCDIAILPVKSIVPVHGKPEKTTKKSRFSAAGYVTESKKAPVHVPTTVKKVGGLYQINRFRDYVEVFTYDGEMYETFWYTESVKNKLSLDSFIDSLIASGYKVAR